MTTTTTAHGMYSGVFYGFFIVVPITREQRSRCPVVVGFRRGLLFPFFLQFSWPTAAIIAGAVVTEFLLAYSTAVQHSSIRV